MTDLSCPSCSIALPAADLAEGWCENCGKKIPDHVVSAARAASRRRARPTAPVAREERPVPEGPTASSVSAPGGSRTTVTLQGQYERVVQPLPMVCMCCGAPATCSKEKKLGWFPGWIYLLAPIGGLPFFVALVLLRKMMTVKMPLCHRHRFPWLKQQMFAAFVLVYVLVLPWVMIVLSVEAEKSLGRGNPLSGALLFGWLIGIPILFVLVLVLRRFSVYPRKITTDSITLGGVSSLFAEKLQDRVSHW
jgi:hypothetical protein